MSTQTLGAERFVRRTQLRPDEYRKNFRQLDGEIIAAVTSAEADAITPLMSKVYLRLANAPEGHWEREGVLRFAGEEKEGRWVTAWEQLVALSGVSSATTCKALRWMREQGIIGYFSGKNGVGIRVFLNRASSSIGSRAAGKKILAFPPASTGGARALADEAAFNDSYADSEVLETDINSRAPKSGADNTRVVKTSSPEPTTFRAAGTQTAHVSADPAHANALTEALLVRLEPAVRAAAAQAAAREHERTREWLESRGLPKAARVAQREAFDLLRRHGLIAAAPAPGTSSAVGRGGGAGPPKPRTLSLAEVRELAETCVAMLEVHGKPVDVTLAELSAEAGGLLLAEDAPKVRELALALTSGGGKEGPLVV